MVENDFCFLGFLFSWYHVLSNLGKKIDTSFFEVSNTLSANRFNTLVFKRVLFNKSSEYSFMDVIL